jgi:hypothetical protein
VWASCGPSTLFERAWQAASDNAAKPENFPAGIICVWYRARRRPPPAGCRGGRGGVRGVAWWSAARAATPGHARLGGMADRGGQGAAGCVRPSRRVRCRVRPVGALSCRAAVAVGGRRVLRLAVVHPAPRGGAISTAAGFGHADASGGRIGARRATWAARRLFPWRVAVVARAGRGVASWRILDASPMGVHRDTQCRVL